MVGYGLAHGRTNKQLRSPGHACFDEGWCTISPPEHGCKKARAKEALGRFLVCWK